MGTPRYSGKELTKFLRQLAMEAEDLSSDGSTITKAEKLAQILWKKALGFKETIHSPEGVREVVNSPEAWAIQMIYERLEGKVANAVVEEGGKATAATRVSELARDRINSVLGSGATVTIPKPPPLKIPRKEKRDGDS